MSFSSEENDFIRILLEKKILVNETEDDDYYNELKFKYNMSAYSCDTIDLTVVPTISCNLRCPYCFEKNKPNGYMTNETISNIINFLNENKMAKRYNLTWFGGEPLLGLKQIQSLLEQLDTNVKLKRIKHSIITNGTLLGSDAIKLFERFPLSSIQITLDGFKETHNEKRFFRNGTGSFDTIIRNVKLFLKKNTQTYVSFRINVDNNNYKEYIETYHFIKKNFPYKNVGVYAGILRPNHKCETKSFFSSDDHVHFNNYLLKNNISTISYPKHCDKGCCATYISSFVIGPNGEIYRCWEHVGNSNKIIGYICSNELTNPQLFNQYILEGHCFNDNKCRECGFLPICTGGCPNKRIENQVKKYNNNLCSIYRDDHNKKITDLLYQFYTCNSNNLF